MKEGIESIRVDSIGQRRREREDDFHKIESNGIEEGRREGDRRRERDGIEMDMLQQRSLGQNRFSQPVRTCEVYGVLMGSIAP